MRLLPKILKYSQVMLDDTRKVNISSFHSDSDDIPEEVYIDQGDYAKSLIENAKRHADEIVSEASKIAEVMYDELEEKIEEAKAEAYEQGKKSGYMDGYNEGMAAAAEYRGKAEQAYNNALAERVELLNTIEPQIVDLITSILNKLIPGMAAVNPEVILCLIKRGLQDSAISGDYKVYVSAADYKEVYNNKEELQAFVDATSSLEIFSDASLNKSDCLIETPFGNIECGLNQQYNSLKDNLYYILNNR